MSELRPSSIRSMPVSDLGVAAPATPRPAMSASRLTIPGPLPPAGRLRPAPAAPGPLPGPTVVRRPTAGARPTPLAPVDKSVRRPVHVVVAVGLTATAYALSLASVSALQIAHDRDLIAERTPVRAAIARLAIHNDVMSGALDEARVRYAAAIEGYDALTGRLDDVGGLLDRLGGKVADIEGLTGILPSSLDLPSIPKAGSGAKAPPAPPKAAPPPPPPANAQTGASGAP